MWILILIALFLLGWWLLKPYIISYDTVCAFTGGLGSGKSLMSVKMALKLLRKNRMKVKWHNLFHKNKIEKPLLFSSIPLRVSRKEWALQLREEHLLLSARLPEKCVVFIDEIDQFASQFEFKEPNILENFNEWARLFRHYTKGGYMVCNAQSSDNIVLQIRRRMNTVFNLMQFKKHFFRFYTVRIRNITIAEDIKTIEEENAEDNTSRAFGYIPFLRRYDTYCYSDRYNSVPFTQEYVYCSMKLNTFIRAPKNKVKPMTGGNNEGMVKPYETKKK